jgi:hypothetical protein
MCDRCAERSQPEIVNGRLEVEPEWFVAVYIPDTLRAPQVAAIRASHLAFKNIGIAEVRKVLAAEPTAILGPYVWPHEAAVHRDRLRTVGLVAEVVGYPAEST